MKKKEGVLISKNEYEIEQMQNRLEDILPVIQRACKAATAIVGELQPGDISRMTIGEDFLREKLANKVESPTLNGASISREAFEKMIDIPSSPREFLSAIDELKKCQKENFDNAQLRIGIFEWFTIKDNEAVIDDRAWDRFEVSFSYYAETKRQIEYLEAVREICDAANKNSDLIEKYHRFSLSFLDHPAIKKREGKYVPNASAILQA